MRPEQEVQKAVVAHYRMRGAPNTVMFAVPNGGFRRRVEAAIMQSTGTVAGASDLFFVKDGQAHALELKADKGKPTVEQLLFLDRVRAAGGKAEWCAGIDAALSQLEEWGLLRGRST